MAKCSVLVCVIVFTIILAAKASANVVAFVDSSTTPIASVGSGADMTIALGEISTSTTVRIFDQATNATTAAGLSVGKVTITGSVASGSGASLIVLVAHNTEQPSFPSTPTTRIEPGVVNFGNASGGLVITNPINSADTSLRDATTLALAVSGDTAGSIDVGRVFRVQALGVTNTTGQIVGGTIASNITAHAPNDNDDIGAPLGQMSVNVVTAGKGITGSIVAIGSTDATTGLVTRPAGIGRVIVGPVESTVGISGDIRAETGRIVAIYTTGPIGNGSMTARTKIWAADGITEIRAISEANSSSNDQSLALAKDIDADIQANRNYVPGDPSDPSRQACIRFVQTGGNLKGAVKAGNLAVPTHNTGDPAGGQVFPNVETTSCHRLSPLWANVGAGHPLCLDCTRHISTIHNG